MAIASHQRADLQESLISTRDARITESIDTEANGRPDASTAEQANDGRVALNAKDVNREKIRGQSGCSRQSE